MGNSSSASSGQLYAENEEPNVLNVDEEEISSSQKYQRMKTAMKKKLSIIQGKDFSGLGAYKQLEAKLPLTTMDIREFEGRIKKLVYGKDTISIRQLQFTFARDVEDFESLTNTDSEFYQIITSPVFQSEETEGELSIQYLLLFGLLYCQGTNDDKAKVFYDVLQDGLQDTISAKDKDIQDCFGRMIEIATAWIHKWSQELGEADVKDKDVVPSLNKTDDNAEKWSAAIETIQEKFLDDVFDVHSKMDRKDFIKQVATKQAWLFKPDQIRKQIIIELV